MGRGSGEGRGSPGALTMSYGSPGEITGKVLQTYGERVEELEEIEWDLWEKYLRCLDQGEKIKGPGRAHAKCVGRILQEHTEILRGRARLRETIRREREEPSAT
jgi:hypothetical protein